MGWIGDLNALVGKKVIGLYGREKGAELEFETSEGVFAYFAEGECCSRSWFEHVSGVDELVGHTVAGFEIINMPEIPAEQQKGTDVTYGYQLTTDKGRFMIEMRNSSENFPYGGYVFGPRKKAEPSLPKIETDW